MAETFQKLPDGTLEISETGDTIITIMTEAEILAKIAETQTEMDHLNINVASAQSRKTAWEAKLVIIQA